MTRGQRYEPAKSLKSARKTGPTPVSSVSDTEDPGTEEDAGTDTDAEIQRLGHRQREGGGIKTRTQTQRESEWHLKRN